MAINIAPMILIHFVKTMVLRDIRQLYVLHDIMEL